MDLSSLTPNTLNYLENQLTGFPLSYNPLLYQQLDLPEILSIRSMHYTFPLAEVERWNKNLTLETGAASLIGYPIIFKGGLFLKILTLIGSLWLNRRKTKREIPAYSISEDEKMAYVLWSELFLRVSCKFPEESKAWWAAFHAFAIFCLERNEENLNEEEWLLRKGEVEETGNQLSLAFQSFIPFSDSIKDACSLTNIYLTGIFLIVFNTGLQAFASKEERLFCQYFSDKDLFNHFKKFALNLPSSLLLTYLGHPLF